MSSLQKFIVDKPVPEKMVELLSQVKGDRGFLAIDGSGGMQCFIVLSGIAQLEIELFRGELTVAANAPKETGIGMVTLEFGKTKSGFSFDMPILPPCQEVSGNSFQVFLVEEQGYILRAFRLVGLAEDLMANIQEGVTLCREAGAMKLQTLLHEAFETYDTQALIGKGAKQHFFGKAAKGKEDG